MTQIFNFCEYSAHIKQDNIKVNSVENIDENSKLIKLEDEIYEKEKKLADVKYQIQAHSGASPERRSAQASKKFKPKDGSNSMASKSNLDDKSVKKLLVHKLKLVNELSKLHAYLLDK